MARTLGLNTAGTLWLMAGRNGSPHLLHMYPGDKNKMADTWAAEEALLDDLDTKPEGEKMGHLFARDYADNFRLSRSFALSLSLSLSLSAFLEHSGSSHAQQISTQESG